MYVTSGVVELGISDRALIDCSRKKLKIPKTSSFIKCRSYYKFVDAQCQADVDMIDWSLVYSEEDLDTSVAIFHQLLNKVLDNHTFFKCL